MAKINPATDTSWITDDLMQVPKKKQLTIRIDEDVLDFYKSDGEGYQTRMNAVLRAFMGTQQKAGNVMQKFIQVEMPQTVNITSSQRDTLLKAAGYIRKMEVELMPFFMLCGGDMLGQWQQVLAELEAQFGIKTTIIDKPTS